MSEDVVIRMIELAHQAVDVGWCVPANVGDKEGNEVGGHVVKHRTVDADLLQNVSFCERKDFFRSHKLVKGIFFTGELDKRKKFF